METKSKESVPVSVNENNAKKLEKITWPSLHPITNFEKTFDKIFGQNLLSLWNNPASVEALFEFDGLRMPSLDLIDREDEILVKVEMPGVEKENIDISIADNVLTIKGHTNYENKEKGDYYRHEISSSSFARSIALPTRVDESKVVADLKHGVLNVTLPKSETSKRKSIKIR